MTGVLDAQVHVGRETTYGTAVTPTRSFEAKADIGKRKVQHIESVGMRAGMQSVRSDRRRAINLGADGPFEVDVLTKGMGMLFRAMMGTSSSAQVAATTAYKQTHSSDPDGPSGESLTVQIGRPPITGATAGFNYEGGKVASWEFSQDVDKFLALKLALDYEDQATGVSLATPAYPASALNFDWSQLTITVGGTAVDGEKFAVKGNNNLHTDRRYLRGSSLKKEPLRKAGPDYSGELSIPYADLTYHDAFINGDILPIVATWAGPAIDVDTAFSLVLTMAACQLDDGDPEVSLSDLPTNPVPFKILWDGTNPAVKLEYYTTDTAF